jgi:hypothetical protein
MNMSEFAPANDCIWLRKDNLCIQLKANRSGQRHPRCAKCHTRKFLDVFQHRSGEFWDGLYI